MSGTLFVVATPIGNLGDFSSRAIETLNAVDFIAAEDTRVSARLLHRFGIKTPQISYFEHNRREKGEQIAARLLAGERCALITDAGTPAISDPGFDLVALCRERGIPVAAVPGCSAVVTALSISGMACGRFAFEGFLSMNKRQRREHLASLKGEKRTLVFYEAPHKLLRTLQDLLDALGDRQAAVCRELTKLHEEVLRTTLTGALTHFQETAPRGEFVLVVAGAEGPSADEAEAAAPDPMEAVRELVHGGSSVRDAVKQVAQELGAARNALYRQALAELES